MKFPEWIFWALVGALLSYEIFTLICRDRYPGAMISEIIWRISTYHPLVPFALGLLMGHFFWQRVGR